MCSNYYIRSTRAFLECYRNLRIKRNFLSPSQPTPKCRDYTGESNHSTPLESGKNGRYIPLRFGANFKILSADLLKVFHSPDTENSLSFDSGLVKKQPCFCSLGLQTVPSGGWFFFHHPLWPSLKVIQLFYSASSLQKFESQRVTLSLKLLVSLSLKTNLASYSVILVHSMYLW